MFFRNPKRKAFYEVAGRGAKPRYDRTLERLHPEESAKAGPVSAEPARPVTNVTRWPIRPRPVQFNAGRIEISIPYQLAIALLLGLVLLFLVVFRLGQIVSPTGQKATEGGAKVSKAIDKSAPKATANVSQVKPAAVAKEAEVVKPKGDNRIVIQTCQRRADLEPVRLYFAQFSIETEIRKIGDWYYLVTLKKYENPEKPGTDGYAAKQKIIELGAEYKAPSGYGTFGTKPFSDAYGMKFAD